MFTPAAEIFTLTFKKVNVYILQLPDKELLQGTNETLSIDKDETANSSKIVFNHFYKGVS